MRITRWDQTLSTPETNEVVAGLARWHAEFIPAPIAGVILEAIENDCMELLCNYDMDYEQLNAESAYHLGQILAFYRKREDLDIGVDKEKVAFESFLKSELKCAETNTIFKHWREGTFKFEPSVDKVFHLASQKIARVLGSVPSIEELTLKFGPGATRSTKRKNACARVKLSDKHTCSEDHLPVLQKTLEEMPFWTLAEQQGTRPEQAEVAVDVVNATLSFVPKNAKTFRGVSTPPSLNMMVQLGINTFLAKRLKRFGVDVTNQERNKKLAREGSITGSVATLDLSSASDTIAIELVAHLLPYDWFEFLSLYRENSMDYKGQTIKLHKFSAMGNGYTFPLETLIFWALSSACLENAHDICSVYGDDIIVPVEAVPLVSRVLNAAGFSLNIAKSFWRGPFRESCGGDYYSGIDVRPIFLSDRLCGEDFFRLHNEYVRRYSAEPASHLLSFLDPSLLLWGPDGYGDGHLILNDLTTEKTVNPYQPHNRGLGWAGYTFETYTWKAKRHFRPLPGDYVLPCYTIYATRQPPSISKWDLLTLRGKGSIRYLNCAKTDILERIDSSFRYVPSAFYRNSKRLTDVEKEMLGVSLPGTNGYKRIKIYTLTRP